MLSGYGGKGLSNHRLFNTIIMKRCFISFLFCVGLLIISLPGKSQYSVTVSQVSGIWNEVSNDSETITRQFVIKPLGEQTVQIKLTANNVARKFSNIMTGTGVIKGNTITFKPIENRGDIRYPCIITMKFIDGDLVVTEKGECEWGRGMNSKGQYHKLVKEDEGYRTHCVSRRQ